MICMLRHASLILEILRLTQKLLTRMQQLDDLPQFKINIHIHKGHTFRYALLNQTQVIFARSSVLKAKAKQASLCSLT